MGINIDKFNLHSKFKTGELNLITDVPGVKVGHVTIKDENNKINTGVTAILPHSGNLFKEKVMAGSCVINGFGKSVGLVQIEELGTIETPIIMTNTLSVGTALTGLVKYMLDQNEDIGLTTGTVNAIVAECNDGRVNDIRGLHVKEEHIYEAIQNANIDFEEGDIGSGTGMVCLGYKGGIGSSSRIVNIDDYDYTVGAIVLSNFGSSGNLVVGGDHLGERLYKENKLLMDNGSIIIVIATDLPLNERQLKRVAKRATISLGRVGSYLGNGSGDIAIAFSTSNKVNHYSEKGIIETKMLHDDKIDNVFIATIEAVEEAIISSIYHSKTNKNGNTIKTVYGLKDFLND